MSNEKLRRENSGFDITFVIDTSNPRRDNYVLEKPIPKGLKAKDFIGHICAIKIADGTLSSNGKNKFYKTLYGTITSAQDDKTVDPTNEEVKSVSYKIVAKFQYLVSSGIDLYFVYSPNGSPSNPDQTVTTIQCNNTSFESSVYHSGLVPTISLAATTDPTTGDVTYTGTNYIESPYYYTLVPQGYVRMSGNINNVSFVTTNKITAFWTENNYAVTKINFDSYLIWPESKVTNASVTLGAFEKGLTTGNQKASITVTFTVPAANL